MDLRRAFTSTGQRKVIEVLRACMVGLIGEEVVPHERHTRELPHTLQQQSQEPLRKTLEVSGWLGISVLRSARAKAGREVLVFESVQQKTPTHF